MHNQKNTRLLRNVQNLLFHLRLTEWSVFPLTLVVLNPVIFKWRGKNKQTNKKTSQGANVRTSCISFDLSQNSLSDKQTRYTHRKTRLKPAIGDAQKLAQNSFSAWRPTFTSRSLQSIARPFQKRFREVLGNARILIFHLSVKAWEEKSLPKSHLGGFFLLFGEGNVTKGNISILTFKNQL